MDRIKKPSRFIKLFFVLMLFEIVIGGSGHFVEIGPVTLRMVFYLFAVPFSVLYCLKKNTLGKELINLVIAFSLMLLIGLIIGVFNNGSLDLILNDLKPLIFFYVMLFFSIAIKDISDIERISKIVKTASLIMGMVYVIYVFLLFFGLIDFLSFYKQQSEIGEIMFRNEFLFFYKGFLYLSIGLFFFLTSKSKSNMLFVFFLFFCILLTLTRGFIIFTVLVGSYYVFFMTKKIGLKLGLILFGIGSFIYTLPILLESIGDRSYSNEIRFIQIKEVIENVNFFSLFFGHGFGVGVNVREIHMEIAFLEIFHKQGLLGIGIWSGMLIFIFRMYSKIRTKEYKNIAFPFLLSVVFTVLQSFTNPYINNPIGLTIVLITIVVFSKLVELEKKEIL